MSRSEPDDREMLLRVEGAFPEGGVPIIVLAAKLTALQRTLFNVASARFGGGRRGTWKAWVVESCQLVFQDAAVGSAEVLTRLPSLDFSIDGEPIGVGVSSLHTLESAMLAIERQDAVALTGLFPDFGQRARVMKSILPLLPETDSDYSVSLRTRQAHVELKPTLHAFIAEATEETGPGGTMRQITGTLYRVEVGTGRRHIGIRSAHRKIVCYFAPEYEDVVRDLIPGSLVEVTGRATLDTHGRVLHIDGITDVQAIQATPLFWGHLAYGDRTFHFDRPIIVNADFNEDLWVYEAPSLGLMGYGRSRAEAINAIRMDFAACWDEIAEEEDGALTDDAIALKHRLKSLVVRVKDGG